MREYQVHCVHTYATLTMQFFEIKFYTIYNTEFGFNFEKIKL